MGRIVSAFPGTGKTYFASHARQIGQLRHQGVGMPLKVYDSDSSLWPRDHNWPGEYLDSVKTLARNHDLVFVSTHQDVRVALADANVEFLLIYPERYLKAEYLYRYRERGSSQAFIDHMDANWDAYLDSCESHAAKGVKHLTFKLRTGTLAGIADVLLMHVEKIANAQT